MTIPTSQDYEQHIARFVDWAQAQETVRAAIMVGSRARRDPPADASSDLDIMLFTTQPVEFQSQSAWLETISPTWLVISNRTAGNDLEWLVVHTGGLFIDYVILEAGSLQWLVEHNVTPDLYQRGSRVLVDKDGWAKRLVPAQFSKPAPPPPPTRDEFYGMLTSFWYAAIYVAKQIRRDDMWMVKIRDGNLKQILLRMLEWHARLVNGQADTWHMGRFAEKWADPRAMQALTRTFGHFDAEDSRRALLETCDLFSWLAKETANKAGFQYPSSTEEHARQLIQDYLQSS